ncbi:MAG TPA: hypothetical protein VGM14_05705 [Streptosporangiaceae bacterium]
MTLARKARRLSHHAMTVAAAAALTTTALAAPATANAANAAPATARPATSNAVAGYAWVDGGIQTYYAFDSASGHGSAVTYSSPSTGIYQIEFANLASVADNADVQVTPYSGDENCATSGWDKDHGNLRVVVDCYSLSGTLTDGNFDLIVTRPTSPPNGVFDYSLVYTPNSSGMLTSNQYNSSRKKNSVKHLGTGKYQLLLRGPKTIGTHGIVHVTPFGAQPGNCELVSWTGSAQGELVNVDCFGPGPGHVAQNREFIVAYATTSSLMGIKSQVVANAFANGKAQLYSPSLQFDSKHGAKVSVLRNETGRYEVLPVGSGGNTSKWGGDVQVSAVGSKGQLCISGGWGQFTNPSLTVECFDKAGNTADVPFTVEWVVP